MGIFCNDKKQNEIIRFGISHNYRRERGTGFKAIFAETNAESFVAMLRLLNDEGSIADISYAFLDDGSVAISILRTKENNELTK